MRNIGCSRSWDKKDREDEGRFFFIKNYLFHYFHLPRTAYFNVQRPSGCERLLLYAAPESPETATLPAGRRIPFYAPLQSRDCNAGVGDNPFYRASKPTIDDRFMTITF